MTGAVLPVAAITAVIVVGACVPFCVGYFIVAPVAMKRDDRKRAGRQSALRIENAPRSQKLVDGEIAAARAEYIGGEIEVDEFESKVERAMRGEAAESPAPVIASVDAIVKDAWAWEQDITPNPVRREPLPDWAKDAIDQELDRLTK